MTCDGKIVFLAVLACCVAAAAVAPLGYGGAGGAGIAAAPLVKKVAIAKLLGAPLVAPKALLLKKKALGAKKLLGAPSVGTGYYSSFYGR